MGAQYDEGPELAPQNFPEVAAQTPHGSPEHAYQQPYQPYPGSKPEAFTDASTYAGTAPGTSPYPAVASPYSQQAMTGPPSKRSRGVICGCSLLVFILSCIIAILSAAVIGLAAGTGVEAHRANQATSRLASLNASHATATPATKTTTVTAAPTATSFNDLDSGCTNDPDGTSGTSYTSFSFLGNTKFLIYCNRDAPGTPFLSLFTANLDTCIDACSAWSMYTPTFFGNNKNTTCGGVSFIPLWTAKANATAGGAPGNCYLKPTPQSFAGLQIPNIGTECHAAILSG